MRFVIPLLFVLLLASAAPAEEPAQSEAPASPEALAALEARLTVLQEHLEHDLAERIERNLQKTLSKRVDDESLRLAAALTAPAAVPGSRAPGAELEQAPGSPMTCAILEDATLRCRLLASRGDR